ncbi:hypothetical protein M513_12774 [Trichuris suis]|uniref:Uncharacterized protein n=1 Tax=Trichuris suis TaxID=68888 RepID=A0A085LN12_9BILA|nr:hypothetical protein M513_12774 [Trichuris suis]
MDEAIKASAIVEHASRCDGQLHPNVIANEPDFHLRKIKEALYIRHNIIIIEDRASVVTGVNFMMLLTAFFLLFRRSEVTIVTWQPSWWCLRNKLGSLLPWKDAWQLPQCQCSMVWYLSVFVGFLYTVVLSLWPSLITSASRNGVTQRDAGKKVFDVVADDQHVIFLHLNFSDLSDEFLRIEVKGLIILKTHLPIAFVALPTLEIIGLNGFPGLWILDSHFEPVSFPNNERIQERESAILVFFNGERNACWEEAVQMIEESFILTRLRNGKNVIDVTFEKHRDNRLISCGKRDLFQVLDEHFR